ncbi:putative glyceraldehyde-3-phosphate dehydrogenase (phosphorylating) [Helianthus annuus]|nr:putative glyceraldehyde-3-phosphate dehydrogenase (phosphorylating) [Helianthus annuus]KAJ0540857.1 putative glyceraldehyde-3-phosphate dehydrogenase (phosphorylating) [Helianthus annuus]KAJ0886331.1 putative glyceraldehyde-3-phosphate dehydrogenase (phosphorylating) [Helianthus annuus]
MHNTTLACMLKYDSTYGPFKGTIKFVDESTLEISGSIMKLLWITFPLE